MRGITEEWVFKAEDDFRAVEALLYEIEIPVVDAACFHGQQCAEKYVKRLISQETIISCSCWIYVSDWMQVLKRSGVRCKAWNITQLPFVTQDYRVPHK